MRYYRECHTCGHLEPIELPGNQDELEKKIENMKLKEGGNHPLQSYGFCSFCGDKLHKSGFSMESPNAASFKELDKWFIKEYKEGKRYQKTLFAAYIDGDSEKEKLFKKRAKYDRKELRRLVDSPSIFGCSIPEFIFGLLMYTLFLPFTLLKLLIGDLANSTSLPGYYSDGKYRWWRNEDGTSLFMGEDDIDKKK